MNHVNTNDESVKVGQTRYIEESQVFRLGVHNKVQIEGKHKNKQTPVVCNVLEAGLPAKQITGDTSSSFSRIKSYPFFGTLSIIPCANL